jgi:hypothetical protein
MQLRKLSEFSESLRVCRKKSEGMSYELRRQTE